MRMSSPGSLPGMSPLRCNGEPPNPVYTVNEAREGVYVRAMLDTGDYILPSVPNHVENGEIIPDKPPLFHWLSVAAVAVRGVLAAGALPDGEHLSRSFDEWSHRFPSALCGVLTVMSIALLGRRLVGDRAGWLAAATLLLSWQFVHQSRYGRVDMVLTCFVTLAMLLAAGALLGNSRKALLAAAVASGLAVLAKGPLGIVLPADACGAWAILWTVNAKSVRWAFSLPWLWAALIWGVVGLSWYVAAYADGGTALLRSQLLNENFHQFTGANSRMRLFYYVGPWFADAFPWNLMALAGLWQTWRTRDRGAVFCAVWWVAFLVFFQVSAYKRTAYLLPTMPAAAMVAGYWLDRRLPSASGLAGPESLARLFPLWKPAAYVALIAAGVGAALVHWRLVPAALCAGLDSLDGALALGAAAVIVAAAWQVACGLWQRNEARACVGLCVTQTALFVGLVPAWEINRGQEYSAKPLVSRLLGDLPAGQTVTVCGLGNDPSMLVLLSFPDPDRIRIVPENRPLPRTLPSGYYLFSMPDWVAARSGMPGSAAAWRVLWHDELRQRDGPVPVVLVERRTQEGDSA